MNLRYNKSRKWRVVAKIFRSATLLFIVLAFLVPNFAQAQVPIANVEENLSKPFEVHEADKKEICRKLFEGDNYNVFGEIVCDLLSIISSSATNLSTEIVCTIQHVGINGNFLGARAGGEGTFSYISGSTYGCQATGGMGSQPNKIFGDKKNDSGSGTDTGFNTAINNGSPPPSQLTHMLLDSNSFVKSAFSGMRVFSVIIALVCTFLIGFAQILHINVNTYAIKKALPQIIIAVIGGFFGLTIIGLVSRLVDFLYRFSFFSPYQLIHPYTNIFGGPFSTSGSTGSVGESMSLLFSVGAKVLGADAISIDNFNFVSGIFGFAVLVIPALVTFAFEYVLALRPIVVELLAIVSPIAFALLILPQTQWIFKKWWTYLLIALSYPLGVSLLFWIMNLASLPDGASPVQFILRWLIKIAFMILVIRLPFSIERDIEKTTEFLSNNKLAVSLGLNKLVAKQNAPSNITPERIVSNEQKLSQRLAQNIVAPVRQSSSRQIKELQRNFLRTGVPGIQRSNIIAPAGSANVHDLISQAHQTNLLRSPATLVQSVKDIKPETFQQVLKKSDIQVWKEKNLIGDLKTKEGQSLDEGGAAVRADAIRKVVRLAEHAEGNQLQNPQAIKLLAQKGALGTLPAGTIRAALDQKIISEPDLSPSFGVNTEKVKDYIKNYQGRAGIPGKEVIESIKGDQADFQSGYFDLNAGINNAIALNLPPTSQTATKVINNVKASDPEIFDRAFDRFGDHFLHRIGQDLKASQTKVEQNLIGAGINQEAAKSLSLASSANVEQAISKIPQNQKTPETLAMLKESLAQRDLHKNVADQITSMATENKKVVSSGIAEKVIDTQTNQQLDIDSIENQVNEAVKKLINPKNEDEIKDASEKINQFYPTSPLEKQEIGTDQGSVEKIKQRAKQILETLGILKKSANPTTGAIDKNLAQKSISEGINEQINNLVYNE